MNVWSGHVVVHLQKTKLEGFECSQELGHFVNRTLESSLLSEYHRLIFKQRPGGYSVISIAYVERYRLTSAK